MKSSDDPRHQKRIRQMQLLFASSFQSNLPDKLLVPIVDHLAEIDAKIQTAAPEWPVAKIAKIDLAILRLSCYELTITRQEPPKAIIDEAIELAKAYGNQNSPQFINGVLGTIYKKL